jgi:hypothetical protein
VINKGADEANALMPALFRNHSSKFLWRIRPLLPKASDTHTARDNFPTGMSLGSRVQHLNINVGVDWLGAKGRLCCFLLFHTQNFRSRAESFNAPTLSRWRGKGPAARKVFDPPSKRRLTPTHLLPRRLQRCPGRFQSLDLGEKRVPFIAT